MKSTILTKYIQLPQIYKAWCSTIATLSWTHSVGQETVMTNRKTNRKYCLTVRACVCVCVLKITKHVISPGWVWNRYLQRDTYTDSVIRYSAFLWFRHLRHFSNMAWTPKLTNWENHLCIFKFFSLSLFEITTVLLLAMLRNLYTLNTVLKVFKCHFKYNSFVSI